MAACYYCGRRGPFNTGVSIHGGWACVRCSGVGAINTAFANAPLVLSNGANLAGVIGTMALDPAETNAIGTLVASANHDSGLEAIWGLPVAARHYTVPGVNVVVVFLRGPGTPGNPGPVTVYAIGRHVGKTNGEYRVMRWDGSNGRVRR